MANSPDTLAPPPGLRLNTREQFVHLLAEAAELEHNLLCCYLYAAFSLKREGQGGLGKTDAARVEQWRRSIVNTAVEEMTHLALIANLTVAVGARPHFNRPNLPVAPLYHPSDIVVELAPFNLDTLDHFIYLERPEGSDVKDGASFLRKRAPYQRGARPGASLMPSAVDYETIGEFYAHLRSCLVDLSEQLGEQVVFCGDVTLQVGTDLVNLPGLTTVSSLDDALAALDTIITQGEGGDGDGAEDSHFARFMAIRGELTQMSARSDTSPAWPAARNPLMRKPANPASGVHITSPDTAMVLDFGNALYALMLRLLSEAWGRPVRNADAPGQPKTALNAAMKMMSLLSAVGGYLCSLPASEDRSGVNAGMTFTVLRATEALIDETGHAWISERLQELAIGLELVARRHPALAYLRPMLAKVAAEFEQKSG